jgi:tetratricopeptide (TPR) repeat protein
MRKDSAPASPRIARHRALRRGVALLGIAAAIALAIAALRQGAADLAAFAPRRALDRTATQPPVSDDARWVRLRTQLERAVSLDAGNPDLQEALGRWHETQALRTRADAELREALAHFRRALALRPSSAYTWASVALLKLRLAEFDDEFSSAAVRAARLGPWEPEVQLALASVAFGAFEQLHARERPRVLRTVANGLQRQGEAIFDIALRSGRSDLFCKLPGVGASRQALRCV